jgi:hypothetical protein
MAENAIEPKKRGRRSKKADTNSVVEVEDTTSKKETDSKSPPKKRGRKPKGGKIVQIISSQQSAKVPVPNIILHLKCSLSDLESNKMLSSIMYNPEVEDVESFQFDLNKNHDLNMEIICEENNDNSNKNKNASIEKDNESHCLDTKNIWKKLRTLAVKLHTNNISEKRSACFWCTCDFDNPPIYIPKMEINGSYQCYGCFCSPECATAHLFNEDVDSAARFERYHMLNHLYCEIYNYEKNIKPAPNPHYTLDKFYGNLTIQEYRRLLKNERLLLVVNKPLVRVLPELHEDNDDLNFNTKIMPSANRFNVKRKTVQSKSEIMNENFNFK